MRARAKRAAESSSIEGFLERIAEDPTDEAGYLVLSDALQERGDPRGQLITLQRADDPEAEAHLERHAEDLLGVALRGDLGHRTEIRWHLGFVRSAAIREHDPEQMVEALRHLLESPSAPLLQRLTLKGRSLDGRAFDYRPAIRLLKRQGPKTLCVLRASGRPGAALDPSLLEAFPRLQRPPSEAWDELQRTLRAVGDPHRHPFDARRAAAVLESVDGSVELGARRDALLTALCLEIDRGRALGVIDALRLLFTEGSLDRFGGEILEQWSEAIEPQAQRTRVPWTLLAAFGGPASAAALSARLPRWTVPHRIRALEILDRIGTDEAILSLQRFLSGHPGGRDAHRAAELLTRRAAGASVSEMLRTLEDGRPPAERSEREQAQLEQWMVDGHRLSPSALRAHYRAHDSRAEAARSVIWGVFSERGLVGSARLAPDGALVDVDGAPVSPERGETLGVAHPIELGEALDGWRQRGQLAGWQVDRPVARLPAADRHRRVLTRKVGAFDPVFLRTGGWREGERRQDPAGLLRRTFPRDNATVVLTTRKSGDTVDLRVGSGVSSICDLHPVTLSELLVQIRALAEARPAKAVAVRASFREGDQVIIAGSRAAGTVFWVGADRYSGGPRYGVRGDDGEVYWVSEEQLYTEEEDDELPLGQTIANGAEVFLPEQEVHGRVFWAGRSRYGDGDRYGVRGDDGETYWVDGDRVVLA